MPGAIEENFASTLTSPSHLSPSQIQKSLVEDQGIEALKDVTYGSIAGTIGKVVEYPFDTVKVRLQSQPHPPVYSGPLDCFRQSLHADGLRGLYRGVSAPLFGAAIETSSLFFSYRIAQDVLLAAFPQLSTRREGKKGKEELGLGALIACGAASGAFTSLLLTPIELVKCQCQFPLHQDQRRVGPMNVIANVFRHQGLFGFWHGQLGTLIRETGGSAAWFGSYESVSAFFRSYNLKSTISMTKRTGTEAKRDEQVSLPMWQQMLAGASAGVMYNFVFFPADTIKSKMQTENFGPSSGAQAHRNRTRKAFWATGQQLWRQQGLAGLYRGCGITVARSAPSSAMIFAIYEGLRAEFG